jgi:ATP-dependent DNA ligase
MNYECQTYREVSSPEEILNANLDSTDNFLQLKQDGIWARVIIADGFVKVFSKTGQLKKSFRSNFTMPLLVREPIVLVGEFMFGSQRSKQGDESGKLYIFDCLMVKGADIATSPYKERYRQAVSICLELGYPFEVVPCYSLSKLGEFWHSLADTHEGFIVRKWSSTYYTELVKLKFEVEDDFVVMGIKPGEGKHLGRMGALLLGQYDGDQLVKVMDCGGGFTDPDRQDWFDNIDLRYGSVVLVKGKGRFAEGALRHPCFVRLRDDKHPRQCILKKSSK